LVPPASYVLATLVLVRPCSYDFANVAGVHPRRRFTSTVLFNEYAKR
jgi:hypothetical protein